MKQQTPAGFEKYGGSSEGGRPPVPLKRMLRIYLLQLRFNLPDPARALASTCVASVFLHGQCLRGRSMHRSHIR
jgi:hypothetical protein